MFHTTVRLIRIPATVILALAMFLTAVSVVSPSAAQAGVSQQPCNLYLNAPRRNPDGSRSVVAEGRGNCLPKVQEAEATLFLGQIVHGIRMPVLASHDFTQFVHGPMYLGAHFYTSAACVGNDMWTAHLYGQALLKTGGRPVPIDATPTGPIMIPCSQNPPKRVAAAHHALGFIRSAKKSVFGRRGTNPGTSPASPLIRHALVHPYVQQPAAPSPRSIYALPAHDSRWNTQMLYMPGEQNQHLMYTGPGQPIWIWRLNNLPLHWVGSVLHVYAFSGQYVYDTRATYDLATSQVVTAYRAPAVVAIAPTAKPVKAVKWTTKQPVHKHQPASKPPVLVKHSSVPALTVKATHKQVVRHTPVVVLPYVWAPQYVVPQPVYTAPVTTWSAPAPVWSPPASVTPSPVVQAPAPVVPLVSGGNLPNVASFWGGWTSSLLAPNPVPMSINPPQPGISLTPPPQPVAPQPSPSGHWVQQGQQCACGPMVFIPDTIKGGGAWKTPDTPEELMGNLGQMFTDSLS